MVAAAHADGQRAGAGLDRLLAVRDEDGQVEDGLVLLRPASSPRQDPRCVVWKETERSETGSTDYRGQGRYRTESGESGAMVRSEDLYSCEDEDEGAISSNLTPVSHRLLF